MKKDFLLKREDGFGTVEMVILIAVLVGIALVFREAIVDFVDKIVSNMFPSDITSFDHSKALS